MKKLLTLACIFTCALMLFACADKSQPNADGTGEPSISAPSHDVITVYATFANAGELVLKQSKVAVTDLDDDKKFTLDEVFVAMHKVNGKVNDYASSVGEWGLSINKFWGDTSGNFGYYVNNAMAMGLTDEVKSGDYITAFIYKDGIGWSDTYTYFDVCEATVVKGGEFELTLSYVGFDENWSPVSLGCGNCTIVVNGVETEFVTDADGRVKLSFENAGTYVLSATSETVTLVPPVCVITVK